MKRTLPLASMEKILRTCGADRVSEGSKEKLKNTENIDVSDWAKGMYIVKLSTNEGIKTGKLIVE